MKPTPQRSLVLYRHRNLHRITPQHCFVYRVSPAAYAVTPSPLDTCLVHSVAHGVSLHIHRVVYAEGIYTLAGVVERVSLIDHTLYDHRLAR